MGTNKYVVTTILFTFQSNAKYKKIYSQVRNSQNPKRLSLTYKPKFLATIHFHNW